MVLVTDKGRISFRITLYEVQCLIHSIIWHADEELIDAISTGSSDVIHFLTVMAICNTVIPIQRSHFFLLLIGCWDFDNFPLEQNIWTMHLYNNTFLPFSCSKNGSIVYKAQSQDEDALVHAAAQLHMVFVNKNANILGKLHFLFTVIKNWFWFVGNMI